MLGKRILWTLFVVFLVFNNTTYAQESAIELDSSFGSNGVLTIGSSLNGVSSLSAPNGLILADGKILVVSQAVVTIDGTATLFYTLKRLSQSGEVDNGFGNNGEFTLPLGKLSGLFAERVLMKPQIQEDSKILCVVTVLDSLSSRTLMMVIRLMPNGGLDSSFGNGGFVKVDMGAGQLRGYSAIVLPDGGILAAGSIHGSGDNRNLLLVKLYSNGNFDPDFGEAGKRLYNIGLNNFRIVKLLRQKDGKILVGGSTPFSTSSSMMVYRLMDNGDIDTSFGNFGQFIWDTVGNGSLLDLELNNDGRIIFTGSIFLGTTEYIGFGQITPTGHLDQSFAGGEGGLIVGNGKTGAVSDLLVGEGKLYLFASTSLVPGETDYLVYRFDINGLADRTFDLDGEKLINLPGPYHSIGGGILLPEGNLMLIGSNSIELELTRTKSNNCGEFRIVGGDNFVKMSGITGPRVSVSLAPTNPAVFGSNFNYSNSPDSIIEFQIPSSDYDVFVSFYGTDNKVICTRQLFVTVTQSQGIPSIQISDTTVDENGGILGLKVYTSFNLNEYIQVIYTLEDSSAITGSDYIAKTDTVFIEPNYRFGILEIPILNDTLHEATEIFKVRILKTVNATFQDSVAILTITDDDQSFSGICDSIVVNGRERNISVEGLKAPLNLLQVYNSNWVEVFKQVYTNSPGTVVVPNLLPGQYYVSVILMQSDWTGICNREFYNVTVPDTAVVRPTVSIGDITVNENDGFASINICVRNARQEYISIGFFTIDGTAVGGEDFTPKGVGGSVSLNKDDSCTTIQVRITNDGLTEQDEYFTFAISALRGEVDLLDSTAVITIKDNDQNGSPCGTLTIEPGPGSIQVNDLVAPIALVQVSNSSWSVIYNEILRDYNGDLTIPSLSAGNYFVRINLFDANWQFICEKEAYFFVPAGNPLPTLSMSDISFNESVGSTGIQVCLSSPSAQAVTVDYETFPINGSFPSARLGIDYILPAGSITIPAGQTCAIIPLAILNDTLQETTEVFSVRFINVVNALMPDNIGIVTILDDDNCSPGAICVRNSCPASTVNLNTVYSIPILPPGVVISWHSGPIATIGNQLLPEQVSSVSQSGSYYAALKTSANGSVCYSATIRVDVTIVGCTLNNNAIVVGSSKAISQINDKSEILRAQPNPFTNSITVWVESERDEKASVSIVDITGRVVTRRSVFLSKGKNSISFENLGNRSSGTYFVNAVTESFNRTIKLVKN